MDEPVVEPEIPEEKPQKKSFFEAIIDFFKAFFEGIGQFFTTLFEG